MLRLSHEAVSGGRGGGRGGGGGSGGFSGQRSTGRGRRFVR
jgi:hypothetical protein